MVSLASTSASAQVNFSGPTYFPVGSRPGSVAIGDFNNDGKQDLAFTNRDAYHLSILLGDGTGNFGAPMQLLFDPYNQVFPPRAVAVGDFNNDAKQDIAVGLDGIKILLGDGMGGFGSPTHFSACHSSVVIVDFNNDGKQDLAGTCSGVVDVLLGDGLGNFGAVSRYYLTCPSSPFGCVADAVDTGDFNNDGNKDLVTANRYGANVTILLGDGTGNFPSIVNFPAGIAPSGTTPAVVTTGDFNNDGKQDLVTTNAGDSSISVLLGDGTGAFSSPINYAIAPGSVSAIGDFNNDGKQDLAINGIAILLGDGLGGFASPLYFSVFGNPAAAATGDFNSDGKQDIVTANWSSGYAAILLNTTDQTFNLAIIKMGAGTGTVTSNPAGINCGADCSEIYTTNTVVTLTATPDANSFFAGWSGDPDCSDGSVTMDANKTCTATFNLVQRTLTITGAGTGNGTVMATGVNCTSTAGTTSGDCSETYTYSTVVALTATAGANSVFAGWSGDSDCSDGQVTMDADKTCTATFNLVQRTLIVQGAGNGNGTATSIGITCTITAGSTSGDCSESYAHGTVVTLTPTPDANSTFAGWSGDPDCSDGQVTMDADRTCTATFNLVQRTLTVSIAGTGSGTVTSNPAGINCPGDCTEGYAHGTTVTLTATPTAGSGFAGWSGCDSTNGNQCSVIMTEAKNVTATFALGQFTLTVNKTGTGSGAVTSSPVGIDCGSDCSEVYTFNTVVVLTATPSAGSIFAGYSGNPDCADGQVTMDADKTCTATFNITYTLGDVNDDGKINTLDARLAQQHTDGIITLTGNQFLAADVDTDGDVDSTDATAIAKKGIGLPTGIPGFAQIPPSPQPSPFQGEGLLLALLSTLLLFLRRSRKSALLLVALGLVGTLTGCVGFLGLTPPSGPAIYLTSTSMPNGATRTIELRVQQLTAQGGVASLQGRITLPTGVVIQSVTGLSGFVVKAICGTVGDPCSSANELRFSLVKSSVGGVRDGAILRLAVQASGATGQVYTLSWSGSAQVPIVLGGDTNAEITSFSTGNGQVKVQ